MTLPPEMPVHTTPAGRLLMQLCVWQGSVYCDGVTHTHLHFYIYQEKSDPCMEVCRS